MGSVRLGIDINRVLYLKERFHLRYFVETGTFKMGSTMLAQPHFARVITIEGYEPRYRKNMASFADKAKPANVEFWLGDSRVLLPKALAALDAPALLWLDAHWCGSSSYSGEVGDECPLREELAAVLASAFADRHVVMIDDARYFTAPPPAPHKPEQWMKFSEIVGVLNPRTVSIHDDVIYAEPL